MERTCACGCGQSLEGMRADARYAGEACRMRARRARQTPGTPQRFWSLHRAVRRHDRRPPPVSA